jgi:hypothetical protein
MFITSYQASSDFDLIYDAAKDAENNPVQAEQLLQSLFSILMCVDVRDRTLFQTPAGHLAAEDNRAGVKLLLKFGANIHNVAAGAAIGEKYTYAEELRKYQNADVSMIATSAAYNGNEDYAEFLRLHHDANINSIAYGAAWGGYSVYAETLRGLGARVSEISHGAAQAKSRGYAEFLRTNFNMLPHAMAYSAASVGNRNYAEYLRIKHGANVNMIAEGAAFGFDTDYAHYLHNFHGAFLGDIAQGAARGGHYSYAEHLRRVYNAPAMNIARGAGYGNHIIYSEHLRTTFNIDINEIARIAVMGGHWIYADMLRKEHGADPSLIAHGAAIAGNRSYSELLRIQFGADSSSIARGAAFNGYIDYAEELRADQDADASLIAEGATAGGYTEYANNLLCHHQAELKSIVIGHASISNYAALSQLNLNYDDYAAIIFPLIKNFFENKAMALHTLAFIQDDRFKTMLAAELKKLITPLPYDVDKLFANAAKIIQMKPQYNYSQCLALGLVEVRTWFMQCEVMLKKGIDQNVFMLIATYLAPMNLVESEDLRNKLCSRKPVPRFSLLHDLRECTTVHRIKLEVFLDKCEKEYATDPLLTLLTQELANLTRHFHPTPTQNEPYLKLLKKHQLKFRQLSADTRSTFLMEANLQMPVSQRPAPASQVRYNHAGLFRPSRPAFNNSGRVRKPRSYNRFSPI